MSRFLRTAMAILLASTIIVLAAGLLAGLPANAATAHSAGWYDTAVCQAFRVYERHHAGPEFTVMTRLARHANTYLRVDAALWQADRARHATLAVRHRDAGFVRDDCAPGNGDS